MAYDANANAFALTELKKLQRQLNSNYTEETALAIKLLVNELKLSFAEQINELKLKLDTAYTDETALALKELLENKLNLGYTNETALVLKNLLEEQYSKAPTAATALAIQALENREQFHGATATDLKEKIGQYTYIDKQNKRVCDYRLSKSCIIGGSAGYKALYKGIKEYQNTHQDKISAYKDTYGINKSDIALNDPEFFRKALIDYLAKHKLPQFNGDTDARKTNPEGATTSMEALIGAQGVELYARALEEEAYSAEYRHALVVKATTHFDGPKWTERPVVIVAGPSACGKSFAAQAAVETANKFLPTDNSDNGGNDVIAVDGGLCRETSQIRKLLVQVATNQDYSGIIDLHSKSKVLEDAKSRVQEAAFASPDVGVVIPETFKGWFDVRDHVRSLLKKDAPDPVRSLMKKIEQLPDTKLIFTRVTGEEPSNFQKVVAFMGSRRAWKVDNFTHETVDLNNTDISESKRYEAKGFHFGRIGSFLAERWFRTESKDKLSMIITNDLILLKPDPDSPQEWLPAKQGDEGTLKFSRTAYEAWNNLKVHPELLKGSPLPTLEDYCKANAKSLIATSAQIDFAIAQKEILKRIDSLNDKIEIAIYKPDKDPNKMEYLLWKRQFLVDISQMSVQELNTPDEVTQARQTVKGLINALKENKKWLSANFSSTLNTLKDIDAALDKAAIELKSLAEPIPERELDTSEMTKMMKERMKILQPGPSSSLDIEEGDSYSSASYL